MKKETLTTQDKLWSLQNSIEIQYAAMLLMAAFDDCKLKDFIQFGYGNKDTNEDFLLIFKRKTPKIFDDILMFTISAPEYGYYKEMEKTIRLIKEAVDNSIDNGKGTITEKCIKESIIKLNKLKPKQ